MKRRTYERIKKEVKIEINRIRKNPKAYIPLLEECLENFDGNVLSKPDKDEYIETQEGPAAYKEAIEFLKNQKPIQEIQFDEEASSVANEYVKVLSAGGGKEPETEEHLEERVHKYLDYDFAISECIDYGGQTGKEVIINLLVDDGVQYRIHRDNLFSEKYGYFGIAVGPHPDYDICTVIDYFGDIVCYKDKEKDKVFQEEKEKAKKEPGKSAFTLTKNGLPDFSKKFSSKTVPVQEKKDNSNIQQTPSVKSCDKTMSEYEEFDEVNNNENPFYDDEEAPEGVVKRKTKFHKKKLLHKTITTTIKIYTLEDGSEETVTIDEVIFDD